MCGIAGIVRLDGKPVEPRRVEAMNRALAHRGPDGDTVWTEGPVGLGHRRLAIIDLHTGDQPMFNEDGSVVTVFNGEIYNFRELQPQLASAGHVFKTQSDTEVLVHGWEEWGPDLVSRLNGMAAFAIYDRRQKKVLLARDRLGVKPLYYYRDAEVLVFASELGGLLASGLVPLEIDREALDLYLHYQYVPAPLTIYRGVRKLPPATRMVLDLATGAETTGTYWDVDTAARPDRRPSFGEWKDRLRALLEDAVKIRLIADVPFGAFLSGGTDSGIVVAMMAARMSEPVRTFSIGLDGVEGDELPRARRVAERHHTRHQEFRVLPEGLGLIPTLAAHFGEPFADSSAVPTWYVCKMARESGVKMVLTGDGGDEMFAGYRRYAVVAGTSPVGLPHARRTSAPGVAGLGDAARILMRDARRMAVAAKRTALRRKPVPRLMMSTPWTEVYDLCMSHFDAGERQALLDDGAPISGSDTVTGAFPYPGADTVIAAAQYCDLKSYLPGDILAKVDRMSMAHSLEVRSPLLDYRIAELAFSMPQQVKMPDSREDAARGKLVLKELAAGYLGRDYVYAPKEGFGIPVGRWLREDATGYMKDVLLGSDSAIYGHLQKAPVARLVESHLKGEADHSAKLWNLLMLDGWFRSVHGTEVARRARA